MSVPVYKLTMNYKHNRITCNTSSHVSSPTGVVPSIRSVNRRYGQNPTDIVIRYRNSTSTPLVPDGFISNR